MQALFDFFINGGLFMVPLSLCSIISIAFIIERGIALRRSKIIPRDLYSAIVGYRIGQGTETMDLQVQRGSSTMARLVRIAMEHLPWSKSDNLEAIQTRARTEVSIMERGLVILEITTGVAPLLGLLGTASGLISVFADIGEVGLEAQGMSIARGISEALNTTVAGLVIAIPSLIAYSYYSKKIEAMTVEMESLCMDLVTKMYLVTEEDTSNKSS
ncbi:MAG: MotA/TolQ/ExbB proton channel family protein [Verrucomicrobiota bacterium]